MRIRPLVVALLALAFAVAGQQAMAQPSLPPLPGAPPAADVESQLARLTQRYGLSSAQAAEVRTILAEQSKKVDEVVRQQLPPEQAMARLKAIKDEESSRVGGVLMPEQRRLYDHDTRPVLPSPPALPASR